MCSATYSLQKHTTYYWSKIAFLKRQSNDRTNLRKLGRKESYSGILLNDVFRRRSEKEIEIKNTADRPVCEHRHISERVICS